ncbi:FecR family protein [Tannerella sp.]|uniref:FecR family protein n=1 Tax=Tannerella sp. TaxID=2382127 RepID=UPI0026DD120E|nr:FecR domain-containing protein [Tannerella sp.]MDO4703032.1 FecR domain-containing protein [Tannerella sp.]
MDDLLLIKFIEQDVTIEEARQVLYWIEQTEANRTHFAELQILWTATSVCGMYRTNEQAIQKIMGRIRREKRITSLYRYYIAAACIVAIIAIGLSIWNISDKPFDYEAAIQNVSCGNKITLKIGGKEEMQCTESTVNVLHDHRKVIINDTIETVDRKGPEPNVLYVPYGKRAELRLSDGTIIYLNSGSTLVYPPCFTVNRREVYLDGEAYFDVSKDEDQVFVVKTLYRSVEVLGTQFNVAVDRELQSFETVLVNGSVMIKGDETDETLVPNQYYSFSNETKIEHIQSVDVAYYIAWTENKLLFKKETLYKAIRKLEKAYNIRIELVDDQYLNYQVSGQLNLRDSAEETVRILLETVVPGELLHKRGYYTIKHNH